MLAAADVSLINAGVGEMVVVYELRKTPMDTLTSLGAEAGGEKDTVFAMRVAVGP